jgi:Fe-S cluster biosynthesis and repair protein YggX
MLNCKRCGLEREGLSRAPLPGESGRRVLEATCRACWESWLGEQVKLINELRLSPAEPEHYELLLGRMSAYLRL